MTTAPNTAVLWMPAGHGKSTHAQAIAALLGCTHVVDEWRPGARMQPGALHLTNAPMTGGYASKLSPEVIEKIGQALKASSFVTVAEIAQACGMTGAPLTAENECLLRRALEAAGCLKAKRNSKGTREWGYLSPHHLPGQTVLPSVPLEPPAAPDTHKAPPPASPESAPPLNHQRAISPAALAPVEPPAPTKPGQCPLCPCSASPECENGSLQTGGAA